MSVSPYWLLYVLPSAFCAAAQLVPAEIKLLLGKWIFFKGMSVPWKIQLPYIFDLCDLLYVNQSELLARFCTDLINHQYEIFGTKTHGDWGGGGGMREGCIRRIDWSKRAKTEGRRGMMSTCILILTRNVSVSFHTNLNTDFWPFPIHLFFWLIAPIYIHTELACKLNALQSH